MKTSRELDKFTLEKRIHALEIQIKGLEQRMNGVEIKLDVLVERFDEHERKEEERYNNLMDKLDWLVGSYSKFDEEHIVLSEHSNRNTDELEELRNRVSKLEKIVRQLSSQ
jgi:hypothetical protein